MPDTSRQRLPVGQTLLIDADDTLWENNIYFERAIASFISLLNHHAYSPEEIRHHLNACERETIRQRGYGLKSFRQSLVNCFEQLSPEPVSSQTHEQISSFADAIATQEIELLPGVADTLADLTTRHRIILVTKGDDWEQRDKLERSGLKPYFHEIEVLPEKHSEAYLTLRDRHRCEASFTWMIGNSPKSDVNPALEAGLNAIFIPHDNTWMLEHEELLLPPSNQAFLQLPAFPHLAHYF